MLPVVDLVVGSEKGAEYPRGVERGGINWKFGIDRYTLENAGRGGGQWQVS